MIWPALLDCYDCCHLSRVRSIWLEPTYLGRALGVASHFAEAQHDVPGLLLIICYTYQALIALVLQATVGGRYQGNFSDIQLLSHYCNDYHSSYVYYICLSHSLPMQVSILQFQVSMRSVGC